MLQEWEKSKENVLPQRGGRNPEDIRKALQDNAADSEQRRDAEKRCDELNNICGV
jgi:hypothetical protein